MHAFLAKLRLAMSALERIYERFDIRTHSALARSAQPAVVDMDPLSATRKAEDPVGAPVASGHPGRRPPKYV